MPDDDGNVRAEIREELPGEARLADTRGTDDRDETAGRLGCCPRQKLTKLLQLALMSDIHGSSSEARARRSRRPCSRQPRLVPGRVGSDTGSMASAERTGPASWRTCVTKQDLVI